MLKPFKELCTLDLKEHVSKKPTFTKDKVTGKYVKTGELDYLNWADCLVLLYENGAERVTFGNIHASDEHVVFTLNGTVPFVRVFVEIDGDRRELDYPIIHASNDVSMERLMQSDVHNATQRGFVKCVAINWGLGICYWQKDDPDTPVKSPKEDLSIHDVLKVKERIEKRLTALQQKGTDFKDILSSLELSEKQLNVIINGLTYAAMLEAKLAKL